MTTAQRLPVILLWHMHQPQYRDALTGRYALPWTYLHAIKDYTDMAAHLEGNAEARCVVNFTPLLIEQLEEIGGRIAAHLESGSELPDPILALLGPESVPTEPATRLELLRGCLRAQRKQMIERFGPYLELATIAETLGTPERVSYASDQFIHDLAVWYHLAWVGETVRRTDPLIARLTERGRDYTAAERRALLELVTRIIPRYRALAERGQCELSVTPYGHPIIPLLLDFQCARDAVPEMTLPAHAAYPGGAARATWHIEEAVRARLRRGARRLLAGRGGDQRRHPGTAGIAGSLSLGGEQRRGIAREPGAHRLRGCAGSPGVQPPLPPRRHRHELLLPRRCALRSHRVHLRHLARR